jgi:polyhydroxyalkanoate synthase subunit PhaC
MALDSPWDVADQAVGAIAPEGGEFGQADVADFGRALASALRSSVTSPASTFGATLRLMTRLVPVPAVAVSRWFGSELPPPVELNPKDRRFADPAWSDNPFFYALRLSYEIAGRFGYDLVDGTGADSLTKEKANPGADELPSH